MPVVVFKKYEISSFSEIGKQMNQEKDLLDQKVELVYPSVTPSGERFCWLFLCFCFPPPQDPDHISATS